MIGALIFYRGWVQPIRNGNARMLRWHLACAYAPAKARHVACNDG